MILWRPFELIKAMLVRRWAKDITNVHFDFVESTAAAENICGLGGQKNQPMSKCWNEIFNQTHQLAKPITAGQNLSIEYKESLFFGYFAPLEHWCEQNLVGEYALWSDPDRVYLLLLHEHDIVHWALRWGFELPHARDFKS